MNRELIDNLLTSGKAALQKDYRRLLEYCREPVTSIQIQDFKLETLVVLKKAGAIGFENGKYFATQEGLDALKELSEE